MVHRDLKPANLKLGPEGRLKVLDFGIAKAARPAALPADGVPPTATGLIRGTAPYMSPEQLRGEPADTRGDVWAFGCLLYEMLTGARPFLACRRRRSWRPSCVTTWIGSGCPQTLRPPSAACCAAA